MPQTVSIRSQISTSDSIGSTRIEFSLPDVRLSNTTQYSSTFSSIIDAASTKTFDFSNLGTKLVSLAFKATRPVAVFIITADKEYEYPLSTYGCFLIETKENLLTNATGIRFEVPPAATPAPSPAPLQYPKAAVELFVLMNT